MLKQLRGIIVSKFNYRDDIYARFTSRKFLAFVATVGLFVANEYGLIQLDATTRAHLLIAALAYIGIEGGVDMLKS